MSWKHIEDAGVKWEVRAVASDPEMCEEGAAEEVLEFRSSEGVFPPRRIAIRQGELREMNDAALRSAFGRARPIGGDFYGRPGKRMTDVSAPSSFDRDDSGEQR